MRDTVPPEGAVRFAVNDLVFESVLDDGIAVVTVTGSWGSDDVAPLVAELLAQRFPRRVLWDLRASRLRAMEFAEISAGAAPILRAGTLHRGATALVGAPGVPFGLARMWASVLDGALPELQLRVTTNVAEAMRWLRSRDC